MTDLHVGARRTSGEARSLEVTPTSSRSSVSPTSFREVFARRAIEPTEASTTDALRQTFASIDRGERLLDRVIGSARRGAAFTNQELIAIQAGVYRYTQALELAGKLVDKLTGAVRQTLQSQQ